MSLGNDKYFCFFDWSQDHVLLFLIFFPSIKSPPRPPPLELRGLTIVGSRRGTLCGEASSLSAHSYHGHLMIHFGCWVTVSTSTISVTWSILVSETTTEMAGPCVGGLQSYHTDESLCRNLHLIWYNRAAIHLIHYSLSRWDTSRTGCCCSRNLVEAISIQNWEISACEYQSNVIHRLLGTINISLKGSGSRGPP